MLTQKIKTLQTKQQAIVTSLSLLLVLLMVSPALADNGNARSQCISAAAQAGMSIPDLNNVNVIVGTEGDDLFVGQATEGPDVFCGLGGQDYLETLDEGDVFLGGVGNDSVSFLKGGTFYGGKGFDSVGNLEGGTFNGDKGNDSVEYLYGGTFNGGAGDDDSVTFQYGGTFNGGAGDDVVSVLEGGTFNGDKGFDRVGFLYGGTFNPGPQ